ncbi:alpha/beta fold hydrolase [Amycolatopsis aidingensis]|uniref:alpha/beta fold hydrolase n=1 Tax=Amycolatopsis aidingensis TaxID=2842453 RepID=UPI001C0C41DF|nr:alpha/beta hydrolase [Amycolatopsis aidingensis]
MTPDRTALGPAHEVAVAGARIRYHQTGTGPPVVFVHGLLANAVLWRAVAPGVAAAGYRCIVPDWPLGAHEVPVPGADLSPPGVADLIASFLDELDLEDVTIVANDTGGALTQILLTRRPDRIGRVVLTPSDCYHRFLPSFFKLLPPLARIPGAMRVLAGMLRPRALSSFAFGWLAKRPMPPEVVDAYLLPSRGDPAIRRDLTRFVRQVSSRYTIRAARSFPDFHQPVLLAWATEDRLFPVRLARRLAGELPNATLRTIDDSYTFVPEDQPQRLTELILEFTRQHAAP